MSQPAPSFGALDAYGARRSQDEVRIIREMLDEDVARFMTESNVDGPAARELLAEPPEIQWVVLQRGPVRTAANPSAALIGRIRDAKMGRDRFGGGLGAQAAGPPAITREDPDRPLSEVERFIMENRLDHSATASLMAEAKDVQKTVMAQGPLVNCRNPSGALMARIRAARLGQQVYRPSNPLPAAPAVTNLAALTNGLPPLGGAAGLATNTSGAPLLALPPPTGMGTEPATQAPVAPAALTASEATAPSAAAATGPEGGGTYCATVEDSRLNEEALKAIQMLNAGAAAGGP